MRVRQEHGIEATQGGRRHRANAPEVKHARPENRVGDQAYAVEVDDERGVPDVRHPRHAGKRTAVPWSFDGVWTWRGVPHTMA